MSIVAVLVGQCGNQLGDELFSQLSRITSNGQAHPSPFFSADGKARCVLVDSEPKVVHGVQERHSDFIRSENVIGGQSGRGNNWGLGYMGVNDPQSRRHERNVAAPRAFHNLGKTQRGQDDNVLTRALCAIHRETRRTNDTAGVFDAILVLHSLAGGTGSGLGSRLVEKIRYYFAQPRRGEVEVDEREEDVMRRRDGIDVELAAKRRARHVVSIAVAPLVAGELATQGLNATLTLRVLLRHADAVLLLRNEDVMAAPAERSSLGRAHVLTSSASTSAATTTSSSTHSSSMSRDNRARVCSDHTYTRGTASVYSSSLLSTLTRRCTTFKEANEVFVGLLLPLLGFGMHPCSSSRVSHPPRLPAGGQPGRSMNVWNDCSITALLRQCCPPSPPQDGHHPATTTTARGQDGTGKSSSVVPSHLLTIVPLPQRTWERFGGAVWRSRLYQIKGAAESMPGYSPSLPLHQILTRTAKARHAQYRHHHEQQQGENEQTQRSNGLRGDCRKIARAPRAGSPVRSRHNCWSDMNGHRNTDWDGSEDELGKDRCALRTSGTCGSSSRRSSNEESDDEGWTEDEGRGCKQCESTSEGDVSGEVCVTVPRELLAYYRTLGRASVAQLYNSLEGVAVVNQVRELNASLLLPLLRSAALKLHVGAFVSTFVDVGVTMEQMEEAYRSVAHILSCAEEL